MDESKTYQPYAQSSSSYTPFNFTYYYCWKFGKQFKLFKGLRVVYKIDCVEKFEKKYKKIFEVNVNFKNKKSLQTTPTMWVFEGEEILISVERNKLVNTGSNDTDYDDDSYSDYSRDINSKTVSVVIYYYDDKQLAQAIDLLEESTQKIKDNIFLITGSASEGFYLRDFSVKLPSEKFDLELNYGKDFVKKHNTAVNKLSKLNETGLVVLNGKPGTGKTTYIKYLATQLEKKIVFVPPAMAEGITTPNFLPFLLDNKNSILVIEDAEKVVGSRESSDTNNGVSNILNMTDGILGDCLNIQIIATLNVEREKIDTALLRKGRLIMEHEFKALPEDNVKRLFYKLGIKKDKVEPMILTDIYNYSEEDPQDKKPDKKFIGFK